MRKVANSSASGGYHVELPSGAGEDVGKVTFTLSIPVAGTYVVWGRVMGLDTGSNSFYAQMDNGVKYLWDIPVSSSFVWHKVGNRLEHRSSIPGAAKICLFFGLKQRQTGSFQGFQRYCRAFPGVLIEYLTDVLGQIVVVS